MDTNPSDVDQQAAADAQAMVDAQAAAAASAGDPPPEPTVDALPAADGVPPASPDHVIERRSFAREDASAPMPVTVITTRDSLLSSKD